MTSQLNRNSSSGKQSNLYSQKTGSFRKDSGATVQGEIVNGEYTDEPTEGRAIITDRNGSNQQNGKPQPNEQNLDTIKEEHHQLVNSDGDVTDDNKEVRFLMR